MGMNVGLAVLTAGGVFGMLCSLLTLYLLRCLARWNGYIAIITLLSLAQLLYDSSVVMVVLPGGQGMEFAYIALRSMSGLWATFLTNVLSCAILYTAWTLRSFNIMEWLYYIIAMIFIPSTVCGVLVSVTLFSGNGEDSVAFQVVSMVYGVLRLASILFNIVCYILLKKKLSMIRRKSPTTMQLTPAADTPLHALATRFKYYPIIQVLSRIGVSFFELTYGHDYEYDEASSLQKKIAQLWYVISLPSAGCGFFVVFLVVTPGAYKYFKSKILGTFSYNFKDLQNYNNTLLHNNARYDVMRHMYSTDADSGLLPYSEWSEEELSDELSSCLTKNSEGNYIVEQNEHQYLTFYDEEKLSDANNDPDFSSGSIHVGQTL